MRLLELIKSGQFRRYEGPQQYNSYGPVNRATLYDFGDGVELKTYGEKAYWLYTEGECVKCFDDDETKQIKSAFKEYRDNKAKEYL